MWLAAAAKQSHLSGLLLFGIASTLTLLKNQHEEPHGHFERPTVALPRTNPEANRTSEDKSTTMTTTASATTMTTTTSATTSTSTTATPGGLSIRRGTFVYLVMGPSIPDRTWRVVSREPDVHVIFLAWKDEQVSISTGNGSGGAVPRLQVHHLPKSSWAQGRNRMLDLAMQNERRQGWQYEYIVFWDDDVRLLFRRGDTNESVVRDHYAAERELRATLLRDRPARASVENSVFYLYYPRGCVRNCAFDAAVDAFHRTVVERYLPYPTRFDGTNWWMSSETMSYRSAVLAPHFCNLYRHVVVDTAANAHRGYPRGELLSFQDTAIDTFLSCLDRTGYSLRADDVVTLLQNLRHYGLARPQPADDVETCSSQVPDVDYALLMREQLESWPSECL